MGLLILKWDIVISNFNDLPIFAHWNHWHIYYGAVIMITYLNLRSEKTDIPIMVQSL